MAVPSRRLKAGAREIRNRESLESQERRKNQKKEEISPEDHKERLNILKNIGIIKD